MFKGWLELSWPVLLVRGLVGILFGIVAMLWPIDTAVVLVVVWGAWVLVDGAGSIIHAFGRDVMLAARVLLLLLGALGVVAAALALFRPGVTAVTLTWVLGVWLVARGLVSTVTAFTPAARGGRGLLLVSAAVDVLLGVLFAANPGASAVGVAFVLGVAAFAWGVVFLVVGLAIRSQIADTAPPVAPVSP